MDPGDHALLDSWALSLHAKSPRTVELYLRETRRFADWLKTPLLEATRTDVLRWVGDMRERGLKGNTVRSRFYCVRVFYAWALEEGEITEDPSVRVTIPRPHPPAPDPLTPEQIRALFKACEGTAFLDRRDMAMMRLFISTGLRAAELISLDLEDVDLQGRVVGVRRGKGGKPRVARFDAATASTLDRYRRVRGRHRFATTSALWLGQRGPLTIEAPSQICLRRGDQAGIAGLHPHRLRHTFAHLFLEAGGNEGDLQKLGGWENSDIMRRYGEARAVDRAMGSYDRVDPMKGL